MLERNAESRFAVNPVMLDHQRSKFHTPHRLLTSFNVGDLIPIYCKEILPGDTLQLDTSKVVRLQTPITPFMDNLYLDTYFFFVPNRLCWSHWKECMGENTQSAWYQQVEYTVPQTVSPDGGMDKGTLWDYFGLPTGVGGLSVSSIPFRAYALIANEWFRTESLTDPLVINTGDANTVAVNTGNYITDVVKGGLPFKVSKYRDYFTSCLPAPQAGPAVPMPGGGNFPVVPITGALTDEFISSAAEGGSIPSVVFRSSSGPYVGTYKAITPRFNFNIDSGIQDGDVSTGTGLGLAGAVDSSQYIVPNNLWAIPMAGSMATINELRTAFQIQRWYEQSARAGQRYIESVKAFFGVTSPDARMQRPEYLGGNRIDLTVMQTVQNSESASTPLGTTGAFSLTTDTHSDFTHSFVEHGYVIGLCCVRYSHTYQQGIERHWSRKDKFDYYWPTFANLGEQPVLNKELYAIGDSEDDEVFGYQEAWADYRYGKSFCTSEMRSAYAQSLDSWHLADDYEDRPYLSDEWIREDSSTVDRVLAVSHSVSDQIFGDFYFSEDITRVMPTYSIPGLIDHH